ncbi:MAG: acetylxylan esterase [Gemmataceae bacterium]|nr:acetylxylan esterase [Gemmataceae bacterium]
MMVFMDASGDLRPVRTSADWALRRQHILAGMQAVMGPLPGNEARVPLDLVVLEEKKEEGYLRKKITFVSEKGGRVPAYLLLPDKITAPVPAVLCLHQTTAIGKGEPAGLGGLPNLHYAKELALRGFITLAPDYPSFGDYSFNFQTSAHPSGTMKGIWNHSRAIDLLQSLPSVDKSKIACIGHSLGGHNTLFVSAFDERIKAAITSCGFNSFPKYMGGNIKGWTSDRYMPRLASVYKLKVELVPFDFPEILGAIAPRPLFISAPMKDSNFEVSGVRDCVDAANPVYKLQGGQGNLRAVYPDCGHDFPPECRRIAYDWLAKVFRD